jgi:hypothetical protein
MLFFNCFVLCICDVMPLGTSIKQLNVYNYTKHVAKRAILFHGWGSISFMKFHVKTAVHACIYSLNSIFLSIDVKCMPPYHCAELHVACNENAFSWMILHCDMVYIWRERRLTLNKLNKEKVSIIIIIPNFCYLKKYINKKSCWSISKS